MLIRVEYVAYMFSEMVKCWNRNLGPQVVDACLPNPLTRRAT